ncbi:hypothetical protein CAPTEDRAFT_225140 [Capitella teleta]|uniref:Mis18 domain-containing protein n=1 Tax=Capitella teleta TaxID=283909 RepID=R7TT68_CAPTE|nr:hypothetical protein CAPTEDRAFT_225140 [Capitella teleta]|eukprot:ELT96824.1 hypothetical protein CAPTEDRAFT_225140 [Capitella teleta]
MAGRKRKHRSDDVRSVDDSSNSDASWQDSVSAETEKLRPIVFYCCNCRVIVGDSASWVSSDNDLGTITLSKMSKFIEKDSRLITSHKGKDLGSTYVNLKCTTCKTHIGRSYKTTPVELDEMRNLFTFDVEMVDSYQLGSDDQTSADIDHEALLSVPKAQFLLTQLRKMQSLIVNHNDRIRSLEEKSVMPRGSDVLPAENIPKKKKLNID